MVDSTRTSRPPHPHREPAEAAERSTRDFEIVLQDIVGLGDSGTFAVAGAWEPPVDIVETPEAMEVRMEIAGIRRQDVSVQYKKHTLVVSGQRQILRRTDDQLVHQAEMRYGHFRRAFQLKGRFQEHAISAAYSDGMLIIRLPKGGIDRGTRRIAVK